MSHTVLSTAIVWCPAIQLCVSFQEGGPVSMEMWYSLQDFRGEIGAIRGSRDGGTSSTGRPARLDMGNTGSQCTDIGLFVLGCVAPYARVDLNARSQHVCGLWLCCIIPT